MRDAALQRREAEATRAQVFTAISCRDGSLTSEQATQCRYPTFVPKSGLVSNHADCPWVLGVLG